MEIFESETLYETANGVRFKILGEFEALKDTPDRERLITAVCWLENGEIDHFAFHPATTKRVRWWERLWDRRKPRVVVATSPEASDVQT